MPILRDKALSIAERVALIALAGVTLSVSVWFIHAYVDGVLFSGHAFSQSVVSPSPHTAFSRLLAVTAVLVGTLLAQVLYTSRSQMTSALRLERNRTRTMYENSPDVVVCMRPDGSISYANARACRFTGRDPDELIGTPCHQAILGSAEGCADCALTEVVATGQPRELTLKALDGSGQLCWLSCLQYPILDADGSVESVVEVMRDITELVYAQDEISRHNHDLEARIDQRTADLALTNVRLEREVEERERTASALRDSEARHRTLLDNSPDMVVVHEQGRLVFVNSAGAILLGLGHPDEALGMHITGLFEPNGSGISQETLDEVINTGSFDRPIPVRLKRVDGDAIDVELTGTPVKLDGRAAVQFVARDITERLHAERTIRRMAYYDALTELPNRTLFHDRLRASIAHARRNQAPIAVAFLDLDDFKVINDTLGHSVGDELLCMVGRRVREIVRDEDTVARLSGDEFTVIARIQRAEDADLFARRLIEGLAAPFYVHDHELHVSASIGVALYPEHGESPHELLKHADTAMYAAKENGHNAYKIYRPEMGAHAVDRLKLEIQLRQAVTHGELELNYQPQVDTRTGEVIGIEALLRWNHPDRGTIGPAHFMAVAEQSGLMTDIGPWVLETACAQARLWESRSIEFGRIAVNLSAREFQQADVVGTVSRILKRTGLAPERLELEITETTALQDIERLLDVLQQLRSLGVRIAIDDFGTGYSSLSYLKRFPIQTLKIAQAFMRDVHENEQSAAIARMMIDLCLLLELDIVAEGVEHPMQLEFLARHGCHVIQGHLCSLPLGAEEITELLSSGRPLLELSV